MNLPTSLCLICLSWIAVTILPGAKQQIDPCNIYGSVYVEKVKKRADYFIYIEKSEVFADLKVFKEDNKLLADDSGLWHFTENRDFADFSIYIESEPDNVDFTIFYIDVVAFAGCD